MNPWIDPLLGAAFNRLGDVALSSFTSYKLLFAPGMTGRVRQGIARRRAAAAFFNARRKVPAYAAFLRERGALHPRRFEDIPPMDKASYIQRWPLEALCQGGKLPLRGAVIDESSGSSGKASNWVRGADERAATRRLIQYSARATFGDDTFILLNAFALGPWATGMNVSMSLVDRCVLKSIGPDAAKLLGTLELLGPKYRYVVTGYPPFLKGLVEAARLDWSAYDICAVVGGEGMSEPLRAALNRCFRKTISSFGASDLEINLAVETDFTIALRQAIASDAALGRDLYGEREGLPMIFQYDPLNTWIESDADRNLLFTLNRLENVSPRIRYNLHDRGLVHDFEHVADVLGQHRLTLDVPGSIPPLPLPLLFHWGRQDSAVAFYGCKLTPEDLQHVVVRCASLAGKVANFALHPFEDERADKRLELWFELAEGVELVTPAAELTAEVLAELARVNQDFRESERMIPAGRQPTLRLFPYGQSPISGQDIRIKRRYIV